MKTKALTTNTQPAPLAVLNDIMEQAGKAANKAAARHSFAEHTARKADNTIRRKRADLALFETFLNSAGVPASDLFNNPQAWRGVTYGIVESFKTWMLKAGYAIGSINGRLSTVRTYAKLAAKAGAIGVEESILIKGVEGYAHKEAKHIDAKRKADGMNTRKGAKKADAVHIPEDIAQAMATQQPNTPQGRRDALIMCLLLEHGLRVGEIAILTRAGFDLKSGTFTFYRPKVDKTQTHTLTANTRKAAAAYLQHDAPAAGIIWRRSCKGTGKLAGAMSEASATRALTKRVELLGRKHGLESLSAHDARHYWATYEARNGTDSFRLQDAGGWNSPAMPARYVAASKIANDGTARINGKGGR